MSFLQPSLVSHTWTTSGRSWILLPDTSQDNLDFHGPHQGHTSHWTTGRDLSEPDNVNLNKKSFFVACRPKVSIAHNRTSEKQTPMEPSTRTWTFQLLVYWMLFDTSWTWAITGSLFLVALLDSYGLASLNCIRGEDCAYCIWDVMSLQFNSIALAPNEGLCYNKTEIWT